MPANPLRQAIRSAVQTNHKLGTLFAKVGNQDHPRGEVISAYRQTIRIIRTDSRPASVRTAMQDLQRQIQRSTFVLMNEAADIGYQSVRDQLIFYGAAVPPQENAAQRIKEQMQAVTDLVRSQASTALGMARLDSEPAVLAGDDDRQGIVRAGPVISGIDLALASLMAWMFSNTAQRSGVDFKKQAVAVLDSRTTNCCLSVHAQIQPFDGLFKLDGTPRFADEMDWSPFHWYCRTSIALYQERFDEGFTDRMTAGAEYVLAERAAGRTPDQSPADAFWN